MNKICASIVMLSLLAVSALAVAGGARSEYTSGSSTLKLKKRSDGGENGHFATFVGKVRIAGTLVVEFDRLPHVTDERDTSGAAFFLPNESSRQKLPAAVGSFYPRPVQSISLNKKPRELLMPIIGTRRTSDLLNGTMPRYELPAVLTIKSFSSWVECDHRIYTAEVLSIEPIRPLVTAAARATLIGC